MKWLTTYLTSSIGQKLVMSLTGLFLTFFLFVHLLGNLQLFVADGGKSFNIYTKFMSTNPFIQATAKGLYLFIILHTVQGILLWAKNRKAKGSKYAVNVTENASFASKNMALLGSLILFFLMIHMGDFWWKFKFANNLPMVNYGDGDIINAFQKVSDTFTQLPFVVAYLLGLVALAFHLNHGFGSAFQTLGWRHRKYTPLIEGFGKLYSIIIPLGFAAMPLFIYFTQR